MITIPRPDSQKTYTVMLSRSATSILEHSASAAGHNIVVLLERVGVGLDTAGPEGASAQAKEEDKG
ncbi:hypothetical protein [Nonomuraea sp. NEAU-A123]|uniref:hypothetical protein n=1 Tax=Nonomuraea sp. NEAU-A123 TaxID=2839649 RepID=UPI001BE4A817|nr:hypothetical protein [Nonomuraea sp. NEAU-A123]MBT2224816.1 hypothetical protein [Nonomuraea sp. NEAU-A123]